MVLTPEAVMQLAAHCAPQAAAETVLALARTESGLDTLAIGVNGPRPRRLNVASRAEAIARARTLIAAGANLDLGLVQINSANLHRLGLDVAGAFEPCRNLAAGAALLQRDYLAVRPHADSDQAALRTALSLYNAGDRRRGFTNGYVARVEWWAAAGVAPQAAPSAAAPPPPLRASWDAFGDLRAATFVTSSTPRQGDPP